MVFGDLLRFASGKKLLTILFASGNNLAGG